jgi:hypothetical protein
MKTFQLCHMRTQCLLPRILWLLIATFVSQEAFHTLAVTIPPLEIDEVSIKAPLLGGRDGLAKRATVPSVPYIRQKVIDGDQVSNKVSIFFSGFRPSTDGFRAGQTYAS